MLPSSSTSLVSSPSSRAAALRHLYGDDGPVENPDRRQVRVVGPKPMPHLTWRTWSGGPRCAASAAHRPRRLVLENRCGKQHIRWRESTREAGEGFVWVRVVGRVRGSGPDARNLPHFVSNLQEKTHLDRYADRYSPMLDGFSGPASAIRMDVGSFKASIGDVLRAGACNDHSLACCRVNA